MYIYINETTYSNQAKSYNLPTLNPLCIHIANIDCHHAEGIFAAKIFKRRYAFFFFLKIENFVQFWTSSTYFALNAYMNCDNRPLVSNAFLECFLISLPWCQKKQMFHSEFIE